MLIYFEEWHHMPTFPRMLRVVATAKLLLLLGDENIHAYYKM